MDRLKIKVFIAEDEDYARKLLMGYIRKRPELELAGHAANGAEALKKIRSKRYDLLFIDIDLPELSGVEVLEKLDRLPYVIFTTAYDEYAVKAFELGAVDYILKPFDGKRFDKAVDRALNQIGKSPVNAESIRMLGLSCKDGDSYFLIPYDDIVYLSSHAKHTVIHTKKKEVKIGRMLKDIINKLPETKFKRIHRQYIINLDYMSHYKYYQGGQYVIFMHDEEMTTLPIGRKYFEGLRDAFKK
jgi:DNA-binding LytR/AlgR family response regulator